MIDHSAFFSEAARHFQESAIRQTGALAGRVPDLISFAAGSPAFEMFPWDELTAISAALLAQRDGHILQYGATRGYRPLLDQIVAHMQGKGILATTDSIVVTTGSQQGLDLVGRIFIDPGDVVLVELPAYSGAIAAFHNLQATLVGVPQDGEGLDVAALDEVVASLRKQGRRVRFVYVTPNFQNPSGVLMSAVRRKALLEAAARHNLLVLEDDPYGSLYFDEPAQRTRGRSRPTIGTAASSISGRFRRRWFPVCAWAGSWRRPLSRRAWSWPSRPPICAAASSTSASHTSPSSAVWSMHWHRDCARTTAGSAMRWRRPWSRTCRGVSGGNNRAADSSSGRRFSTRLTTASSSLEPWHRK